MSAYTTLYVNRHVAEAFVLRSLATLSNEQLENVVDELLRQKNYLYNTIVNSETNQQDDAILLGCTKVNNQKSKVRGKSARGQMALKSLATTRIPIFRDIRIMTQRLFPLIKKFIEFPHAQICKHAVAADLLSFIQSERGVIDQDFKDLAKAVVNADDEKALEILNKMIANN